MLDGFSKYVILGHKICISWFDLWGFWKHSYTKLLSMQLDQALEFLIWLF